MADKTIVIRLAVRANNFTQGLNQAGGAVNQFAVDVSRGAERASSSTMALASASAFAGKAMLLGIGGAMAVSAQAAIEFESSLAGVAKTVDFTGSAFANAADPIKEYGLALRSLSLRTPLGVNELAKISEVGGQLGIQTGNLIEFTETMAALGVSTNMSAEEAATGLARFANIMGTSQKDFDVLGSIVVELGNNLATTESEILTFGTRLAAVGQTINASEADILALGAGLSSLGVPAERGGTAVQRVFIEMKKAIDTGSERLNVFAETAGVTGEEFVAMFGKSPGKAFEQFVRGLDTISESGGNVFRVLDQLDLDSVRTTQVLLAAAGGADVLAEALNLAGREAKENTALFEEAARRYGTTESQIQLVANAFNDLRIEIGDMLLGSGGLVAAMDFLKELFTVIKDNLDTIGSFAAGLSQLVGLKFVLWLINGAREAVKFAAGLRTAATGARVLGVASATLNLATLAAAAAAVTLAVAWGNAAREAAEMRRFARDIEEAIQGGATATDAMLNALENKTAKNTGLLTFFETPILNDEWLNSMRELTGYSKNQFMEAMLNNVDIFEQIGATGDNWHEKVQNLIKAQGRLGDPTAWTELEKHLLNLDGLMEEARRHVVGFETYRIGELADAMLEAGLRSGKTNEELDAMARNIFKVRGFATTLSGKGLLQDWLDPTQDAAVRWAVQMKLVRKEFELTQAHWMVQIAGMEDGEKILEDLFDGIGDAAEAYRDRISQAMEEASDSILGSFPAWDEYEKETIDSLAGVIKAQDLYLADMTAWTSLQGSLIGQVSQQTFDYLDGLDAGTKGALTRFAKDHPKLWTQFLRDLDTNFAEANRITMDNFLNRLPVATQEAIDGMIVAVKGLVDPFGFEGQTAVQAFIDNMNTALTEVGFTEGLETLIWTDNALRRALFETLGTDLAAALIQGLVAGLDSRESYDAWGGSVVRLNQKLREKFGTDLEVKSPSRFTMRIGEYLAEGLRIGLESGMPAAWAPLTTPIQSLDMPTTPIVNVNNPPASKTATVQIHNPATRDLDRDLSYAATIAGLMTEVGG